MILARFSDILAAIMVVVPWLGSRCWDKAVAKISSWSKQVHAAAVEGWVMGTLAMTELARLA